MTRSIVLPKAREKAALCIIDVQPATLSASVAQDVLERIVEFVTHVPYAAYLVAEYYAPEESRFFGRTQPSE